MSQGLQYIAVLLGIIVQPYLAAYQSTGNWNIQGIWGQVLASVIIGFVIFPSVYKNTIDPTNPPFVQFCLLFVAGMGWQNLLDGARTGLQTLPG